jgi:hypothetical protein
MRVIRPFPKRFRPVWRYTFRTGGLLHAGSDRRQSAAYLGSTNWALSVAVSCCE